MEFTTTKGGQNKILLNGFSYMQNGVPEDKSYWRCADHGECGSKLTLIENVSSREPSAHSHPPSNVKLSALRILIKIKKRSGDSQECTSSIIM